MTFDAAFVFRSAPFDPADGHETLADVRAELVQELADRRRLYPQLVAKGRMTQAASAHEQRVMAAMVDTLSWGADRPANPVRATWSEKIHCLRREIAIRRTLYPRWLLAKRITADDAERRLRVIENWHQHLWDYPDTPDRAEAIAAKAPRAA